MTTIEDFVREAVEHARAGRTADAIDVLRKGLEVDAQSVEANWMLGTLLGSTGKLADGIQHLERAWALAPTNEQVAYQLGAFYSAAGQLQRSAQMYQKTVQLAPNWHVGLNGLARAFYAAGEFEQADQLFRRSLEANPDQADTSLGLAGLLIVAGKPQEAVEIFRRVARLNPGNPEILGKFASALNYADNPDPSEIAQIHRMWGQAITAGVASDHTFTNDRSPDRKLKVGLLSPDLFDHSVAYFLISYLRHRDRSAIEITCYNLTPRADWMTAGLKGASDHWHDLAGRPDTEVADQIRRDQMDIVIELAGHTSGNSLHILRSRTAPVQASYIGYPNTTGLPTIDYRIVDSITDTPQSDALNVEKLVRLPGCFLCYSPPPFAPEVGLPPCLGSAAQQAGEGWNSAWFGEGEPVTFGSFNSIRKLSPSTIDLWSKVLHAVPRSRIALKTRGLGIQYAQQNLLHQFNSRGITSDRVAMVDALPNKLDHWNLYRQIDIALDTTPYNGTTTTCEALYMGVPVITLQTAMHAGRVSSSLLHAAGLQDLVATSPDDFVAKASALAADRDRLTSLRTGMRQRLASSTLLDAPSYAKRLDGALRDMWRAWCSRA